MPPPHYRGLWAIQELKIETQSLPEKELDHKNKNDIEFCMMIIMETK